MDYVLWPLHGSGFRRIAQESGVNDRILNGYIKVSRTSDCYASSSFTMEISSNGISVYSRRAIAACVSNNY